MGGEIGPAATHRPGAPARPPGDLATDPWSTAVERSVATTTWRTSWWLTVAAVALGAAGLIGAAGTARQAVLILALASVTAAALLLVPRSAHVAVAAAVAAVVLAAVAARSSIGGRQLVLVLAGTATACGALGAWTRRPGPAVVDRRPMALAVGPLVAAQVIALRAGSDWAIAALVGISAAIIVADLVAPAGSRRAEQGFQRGVRVLVAVVAAIIVFPVVLICLYIPGAIVRIARAASPSAAGRAGPWIPYRVALHDVQIDANRPFASTPRPVRVRRHLAGLALVATVALITGIVVARSRGSASPSGVTGLLTTETERTSASTPQQGSPASKAKHPFAGELAAPYSSLPAYQDVSWADALQQEDGTSEPDVQGRFVNVDDRVRASIPPPTCDCKKLDVWLTGGSAAFGVGQRDAHTIASQLVRIGESADVTITMKNIGRSGGVLFTEVDDIRTRLETEDPPDLIIFFDGFNDALFSTAFRFTATQGTDHEATRDGSGAVEYIEDHPDAYLRSDVGAVAASDAVDLYRSLRDQMVALARSKGIATAWFFQPDAFTSHVQLEGYEPVSNISPDEFVRSPLSVALGTMATSLESDGVVDLRPLFARYPEPVFLGIVHQNEYGAAITAEAIYEELAAEIERLAS